MLIRLGRVLYWTSSALAVLIVIFAILASIASPSNAAYYLIIGVVAAVLAWLIGAALRYVLAGEPLRVLARDPDLSRPARWNLLTVAGYGAVLGLVVTAAQGIIDGRTGLAIGSAALTARLAGTLVGGAIGGAILFGLVAGLRNLFLGAR